MKPTLNEIQVLVVALAEKIKAPQHILPTYEHSVNGALPHIEIDVSGGFSYVVVEGGQELRRELAIDSDDLLHKVLADVTFSMACDFEKIHWRKGQDFRRQPFAKQEELLGMLNEEWKLRELEEHHKVLRVHPFDDKAMA